MKFDWERLFTPSAWVQSTPTNWDWDEKLNKFLDTNPVIVYLDEFHVEFQVDESNRLELWIANFPYAYGFPYSFGTHLLPSYTTRKRLRKYILENKP